MFLSFTLNSLSLLLVVFLVVAWEQAPQWGYAAKRRNMVKKSVSKSPAQLGSLADFFATFLLFAG